jgi:hypothetical protein
MPIDPRTGYFYPQLNNNIHINSFDYPTFLLQDAVPLALSGAGRLFASGSGDRESVYYLRSSGQIIDLYNTEGYLDIEILDELTIDGVVTSSTDANSVQFSSSITFHNDSPNFHLDSLNSSLILSSSHNSEIYVSGNLGVEEDVNLKLASKLVFDSDTDSNTYITKNGTDGYLEFFMNGTRTLMMINSRTLFYTSPEFTAGLRVYSNQSATMYDRAKLNLGSSGDYWQTYNNAATPISGAFEFWSSNIDDNGTDSKIYWIQDGTKNINFSGSHVFGVDADPNSAHIISTQSDLILSSSHNSIIAISGNLDMKNNDINNVNALQFNLTPIHTHSEGSIHWDADDKTLKVDMEVNGVSLQVGQEIFLRATNKTGSTISNGDVAFLSGSQGQRPKAYLADNTSKVSAHYTIGIATHDIENNRTGYVTTFGYVRDLDTTGTPYGENWGEGDILWLGSTPGSLTNVNPLAPLHRVRVATVITRSATVGILLVNIDAGSDLEDVHDIALTSIANRDILQYNSSNQLWENVNSASLLSGSSLNLSFRTATSDYKLTDTDYAVEVQAWNNDVEIMLPTANGIAGRSYRVILNSSGSYDLTVAATGSETINGSNSLTIDTRYVALSLISNGSNWLIT